MRFPGSVVIIVAMLIAQMLPASPPAPAASDIAPGGAPLGELLSGGPPPGPIADPCRDRIEQPEGTTVLLDGTCSSSPDSEIIEYRWDYDILVDSSGDGVPDNDVDSRDSVATVTWSDDYLTWAELTVVDATGASDSATIVIAISNVGPAVRFGGAYLDVAFRLRVSGGSWQDVKVTVYRDYGRPGQRAVGAFHAEPWSSSRRDATGGGASFNARIDAMGASDLTAVVTYTPFVDVNRLVLGDPHVDGQAWGLNTVTLDLTFADGTRCGIDHTFEVRQPTGNARWNFAEPWVIPLSGFLSAGVPIEFRGAASDRGTDDFLFVWDWGDGTITWADGLYDSTRGRDPKSSPSEPRAGGPPTTAVVDIENHAFPHEGTYRVFLLALDDDGGVSAILSFLFEVPGSRLCR